MPIVQPQTDCAPGQRVIQRSAPAGADHRLRGLGQMAAQMQRCRNTDRTLRSGPDDRPAEFRTRHHPAQLSAAIARAGHTAVALDLPDHRATEVDAPDLNALSYTTLRMMATELARGRLKALTAQLATPDRRQRIDILRPLAQLGLPVVAVFGPDNRIVAATDSLNLPLDLGAHFLPSGHMPQWDAPRGLADFILRGTHG